MANRNTARPLIVKRVKRTEAAHHGGAWKVAYADFVTAMMAFFLLMWLLSATSDEQRKGIAEYFDPTIPLSDVSGGGHSLLFGDELFARDRLAGTAPRGVREPDQAETARDPSDEDRDPGANAAARDPEEVEAELSRDLEHAFETAADGTLAGHFHLRLTPEGLVIEIVDLSDQPLFAAGSAQPGPVLEKLLGILVPLLARTTNDIAIVGHTDDRPFQPGATYTNWELSADRANAARRIAARLGLPSGRIVRVSGVADTSPFGTDPAAPQNRRIAIVMLREGRR